MNTMKTVDEIRRANLQRLVDESGGISALNTRLGRNARDSTFNQILNRSINSKGGKPKTMGPRMARSIESVLSLPKGWMDADHSGNEAQGITLLDRNPDIVTISRYETGGSMGDGVVLHDQPGVIESWRVSKQWLAENRPYWLDSVLAEIHVETLPLTEIERLRCRAE